jgi:hypothetical protein
MKKNKIIFTNVLDVDLRYSPKPSNFIPDWYKNTESYSSGNKKPNSDAKSPATIKRCMPIFDSMNLGYIITTYVDLYISPEEVSFTHNETNKEKKIIATKYQWPSLQPITFHDFYQASLYPEGKEPLPYPKFENAWGIETPKGYSTLFISPLHRDSPFKTLEGVVDTDKYTAPVNFPFILKDPSWEGLIPAGTPIMQAIPFKRDSWSMEIGKEKSFEKYQKIEKSLRTRFFDTYKELYRSSKDYN